MTPDLIKLRELAEKATKGPWERDWLQNEGSYGNGTESSAGYRSYTVHDSSGKTIVDTSNSDLALVEYDCDDTGGYAWDETGRRNAEYIAAANPTSIIALIDTLEAANKRIAELESALKLNDELLLMNAR